jgi:hypothetical protein
MFASTAVILALVALASSAGAQSILRDEFEGPEPVLRPAGGDATFGLETHQRVQQGVHGGRWCEHLRIAGNNGTAVYFSRPIGPARMIAELAPRIWLKADRGGLAILAHVVLPRSKDPATGKPLTTLVHGTDYRQVGSWQQLQIDNLPLLVERQVRVLRTQFGPSVDPREAYVDRIMLNVYGGPGVTNVWVDDLEVGGIVPAESISPNQDAVLDSRSAMVATGAAQPSSAAGQMPRVELKSSLLLVDGKPFFPRAIEHRGEPLARLKSLGFNTVRMSRLPSAALLDEARGLGLWLVAPPPSLEELEGQAGSQGAIISARFDPVLAWDLGSGLASHELERTRRWAKLLQSADPRQRPLVCEAESDLRDFTRSVNVLLARRDPLGTSLPIKGYMDWLTARSQLARGGTPLWVMVQTELPPRLLEQMALLSGGRAPTIGLQESQIRMLVHAALATRARGLCFASSSRLDASDAATERRAAILELLNLELRLIEPWAAAGNSAVRAATKDEAVTGAVIETDRSRLLMPIYAPQGAQFAMGNSTVAKLSFVVPGVPEGNNAYELSLTSFRPLHSDRVAGGTRVILGEADGSSLVNEYDSLVVFTQDETVIRSLRTRLDEIRQRAAQLTRDVVTAELAQAEATEQRLKDMGRAIRGTGTQIRRETARQDLAQCDTLLKTDAQGAYYQARHAQQALRIVQRAHWDQAVPAGTWPLVDAFAANFATLPEHYQLAHELAAAPRSANRLPEGDCEDPQRMLAAGWKHYTHPQANVKTGVDWSPQAAHWGRTGLRLWATPEDPKNKPRLIETPPLWVTTAAVSVDQGDLVQIQGWLRVAGPINGSVDGLLLLDSLSGEAMALRAVNEPAWRQFTLYRVAGRSGPMQLTFALSGLGEAWIDDVSVQIVQRGRSGPSPQAQHSVPPASLGTGR